MVLDFGLLKSNLFPQSDAVGEGMTAGKEAIIAWSDVGVGMRWVTFKDSTTYTESGAGVPKTLKATYSIDLKDLQNNIILGFKVETTVNATVGGGSDVTCYFELITNLGVVKSKSIVIGASHGDTVYYLNWFWVAQDTFTTTDLNDKNVTSAEVKAYLETGANVANVILFKDTTIQVLISDRLETTN